MDALRKAEEQKRRLAAGGDRPEHEAEPHGTGLALEPLPPPPEAEPLVPTSPPSFTEPALHAPAGRAGTSSLPELPSRLEDLDEQFMAHAAKPPPRPLSTPPTHSAPPRQPAPAPAPVREPSAAQEAASRESARMLFEAKQPKPKGNRSFAIAIGLITLVAAIGIGGYFWWQLQPKGGLGSAGMAARPPATAPAPIAAAPSIPSPPPAVPPALTSVEPAAPTPADIRAKSLAEESEEEEEPAPPPPKPARAAPPAPAAPAAESPIRLSTSVRKTDPLLEQAWQAFNNGELDLAHAAWQKALAADPRNADALHGLAAVALQRQQAGTAIDLYLRALEADPKDALAFAGLATLKAPADARHLESRLKTLLAEQPDSSHLNFALGNLYARDARWPEAQQAYFRAHAADSGNPDFLFNLAVSLDQMHQPRLAAQYYNQALAAGMRQPAGFDATQVAERLKTLQAAQ
ncbi:MAG: tetratricopeptide repeat protein [Pseudomonadota bacterium]